MAVMTFRHNAGHYIIYGFSNPIAIMLTLHALQDETITLQGQMNNFEGEIKCLNLFHRSS